MPRASKALAALRVQDLLAIRLDGAQLWDVSAYVRGKEADAASCWHVTPENPALSDRQIARYVEQADTILLKALEKDRQRLLARHVALRRNLYARAMAGGEFAVALSAMKDECRLLSLYEPEPTDPKNGKLTAEAMLAKVLAMTVPTKPPLAIEDKREATSRLAPAKPELAAAAAEEEA